MKIIARMLYLLLVLWVLSTVACMNSSKSKQDSDLLEDMQYPVLLVDGLARRGDLEALATFDDELHHLRELGAQAYMNNRDAFGSIETNAELLAADVDRVLAETNADRLHIIAHSKGGLDARYLITAMGYADKIATLTTIATPHRGTAVADYIVAHMGDAEDVLAQVVDWVAGLLGDEVPDSEQALHQLTRESMQEFNQQVVDQPQVRYISYAARVDASYPHPVWARMAQQLYDEEGSNDGLVSVYSARWGEFAGIVNELYDHEQVGHRDVVGMNTIWNNMGFPYLRFITDVVLNLEE